MNTIREPAREIPVVEDCDICVAGGSCTGVFAAVRAARLGVRVVLIEGNGFFGGVATASLVNVWHSLYNTTGEKQIIAGLTAEISDTLRARGATINCHPRDASAGIRFNSAEMILALDELVDAHKGIRPMLHTRVVGVVRDADDTRRLAAVIIENVSGRRAIRAKMFIDATGNADLLHLAGVPLYNYPVRQPPTTCALYSGIPAAQAANPGFRPDKIILDPANPKALRGFLWDSRVPGLDNITMVAGTRVNGVDLCDAEQLTFAEMEGRRQVRRSLDLLNAHPDGGDVRLVALPSHIGTRDTRHANCLHCLTERELLEGVDFPDTIGHGSYRVDVHYGERPGLVFRYLDGGEVICNPPEPDIIGRWREEREVNPTWYNLPYRAIVPKDFDNVLVPGRALDADRGAFGAARVMVNLNQMGEAAGVAAVLATGANNKTSEVDYGCLRDALCKGGSIVAANL